MWVWANPGNYKTYISGIVDWGSSKTLASVTGTAGDGVSSDAGSTTITLSSASKLRTYVTKSGNMRGAHATVSAKIQIRFDK